MGRFVLFDGPPTDGRTPWTNTTTPTAGGEVDGCTGSEEVTWGPRWTGKGTPIRVELGGSVSAGDDLETDSQGRAVQQGSGEVVARALESGTSGAEIWAVLR